MIKAVVGLYEMTNEKFKTLNRCLCCLTLNPQYLIYTVSEAQVKFLRDEYDIFLMDDGRVNMCAFTTDNTQYIADAIAAAVKKFWLSTRRTDWCEYVETSIFINHSNQRRWIVNLK